MAKPPAARPANAGTGTPGRVRAALAAAAPKPAKSAPAAKVTAQPMPGEKKKRGRPAKRPGELSMSPDAVRAREARAARAARAPLTLTPEPRSAEGATMTPDHLRTDVQGPQRFPAPLSGPIHSPAPMLLAPELRAKAIKSGSGMIKGVGILFGLFYGPECHVSNEDALNTAELLLDAWPELADQLGDAAKGLASMAVLGLVGEKVNAVRAKRGTLRPVASAPPAPTPAGLPTMAPQGMPPAR